MFSLFSVLYEKKTFFPTKLDLKGIKEVDLNYNNTQGFLNETYSIIKKAYTESKEFSSQVVQNMEYIADMLDNVAQSGQRNLNETQVIIIFFLRLKF